ncbi:hypothetical protein OIDMADRAFT_176791 [Oidiodendron maius Zn]|uniref:Transcription factor domain-containing protein n=1 Tax=Oidiodendron maius (strain Zn) TaxID=913774 RepID=A0A0C3HPX4_OIDMZ|nr:hypothetical protein OIDMADRAFT_176791 [Oidiodendron maius Zn]
MQSAHGADAETEIGKVSNRACESCYRAKAKCIPQAGRGVESDKCSRNTAQLEKKIESLVALLSTGRSPVSPIVEPRSDIHVLAAASPSAKPNIECLQDMPSNAGTTTTSVQPAFDSSVTARYAAGSTAALTPACSVASDFELREERAEKLLRFKEQFQVHIPVEFVLPGETPQGLQASRPWLYRTVMMLSCQEERNRQIEQGNQIARDLMEAMLIRGEKSLDMFQALLVYNTWNIFFTGLTPQTISAAAMQLAIAMSIDLGLNRPARQEEGGTAEVERWALNEQQQNDSKRTLDERRAYVYCYLLTSTSSQCVKKIESFNATPYLEYCCQVLIESAESELDIVLAYSVKLQAFTECINRTVTECSDPNTSKAPIWMHVSSAKIGLQNIAASIPLDVRGHIQLCMKYRSTEIFLYDSCIQKHLFPTTGCSQRLDMLYSCLLTAKQFLDLVLEQPRRNYLGYNVINCSQIGHACSTLIKLSFVEEDGWNLGNVRETINLPFYLNQFITNFEAAGETIDRVQLTPCKASFPTGCSRAMRRVLAACEQKYAAESGAATFQEQQAYVPLDEPLPNISYDHFDNAYWEALISDFVP